MHRPVAHQDAPSPPTDHDSADPGRWRALAVCLLGGFMVLLDVSIVNVALPSIREGLNASQSELQWVVSGYALTFGLVLVPAGRLGDVRGQRGTFAIGLVLFTLASAACGLAPTSLVLVVARLAQGLAGGMVTPQISALIQRMFSGAERGKAFGIFGSVIGVSTAIGPLLGGVLIAAFGTSTGWRWVFFVNVPVGIVTVLLAWRLLPADSGKRQGRHDYDLVGVVLLGLTVVSLLLPLVEEQQWTGRGKWLLLIAAAVLLAAFVVREHRFSRRGREPMVELGLFNLRSFSFGTGLILVYFAGFTPLFFVYTLFLQNGLHYSALRAGLSVTPFALGSASSAALAGRAATRLGRPLVVAGLVVVAIGFAGTLLAVHLRPSGATGWATAVPLLVAGIGGGLVIAPNQTITVSQVPGERAGTAGGLVQAGQRIGAAVGIAAVGSVFFAQLSGGHGKPDFSTAFEHGMAVALAFVLAALMLAVIDVLVERARR